MFSPLYGQHKCLYVVLFFYIELYIIYTVQMVICIELYTCIPDTQLCSCDIIIQKLMFALVKLSFDTYNGLKQ